MSAHALRYHARHARPRPARMPVSVVVRHRLLSLLAADPTSGDSWRAVALAVGDLMEEFFSVLAIVAAVGIPVVLALILVALSGWLILGAGVVGLFAFIGWRLHLAVRRLEEIADEEVPR